jgi:5'-3' exonuclease
MGIPSYFRHILKKYPCLIKGVGEQKPLKSDMLLVDFNCLIYGCLKSKNLPIYTPDSQKEWEDALLHEIKSYVVTLWRVSGSPSVVFLAVDGVVPMAKIRQQRLRRFKSVWLAQKEREAGIRSEHTWDSNAITPGTQFMDRLTHSLQELCNARGAGWSVSGAEKFGEGEQKVMEYIRAMDPKLIKDKNITVYGLDADLIVLSLLHSAKNPSTLWSILRESMEFGKGASTDEFTALSIYQLLGIMFPMKLIGSTEKQLNYIYDYIAGMTLLGNDFLPHSIGFTIRDYGHDRLLKALEVLHKEGRTLTDESQQIVKKSLLYIIELLAESEEHDIKTSFRKKYGMPPQPPRNEAERAMLPVQNLPLEWAEEKHMWGNHKLNDDWTSIYYLKETPLFGEQDIHQKCMAYFTGLQWVVNYYSGKPVSTEWVYPWTYPPLWKDLLTKGKSLEALPLVPANAERLLQPQEQLALVLPYESWSLIRNAGLKSLPSKMPAFWPKVSTFHSLGKRWLWECSPCIPIITPKRLYANV